MIYDCFMLFNELDLLEIRLNILNNVVDKFIISESTKTHSNQPKKLYFEENKERFKDFLHKIEYIVVDYDENTPNKHAWDKENYQRDVMVNSLKNCSAEDIIIISDLDEIPNPNVLINLKKGFSGIKVLEALQYSFYLNYLNTKEPVWTRGTRIFHYKDLQDKTLTGIRLSGGEYIKNAGWHFTFLGGVEKVKEKIKAFAHMEFNNEYYTDTKHIEKAILEGKDIFERGYEYEIVGIDSAFPEYIRKNKEKLSDLILKQPNQFISTMKKSLKSLIKIKDRSIKTYETSSKYEIFDFISPNSQKILEIGQINQDFSQELKDKFKDGYTNIDEGIELLNDLNKLNNNFFDCIIFNDSFSQIYDSEAVLNILKQKMNVNGCIIATIHNMRYIEVIKQFFLKKQWKYSDKGIMNKKNIKFFTKKSLENLFSLQGYFFITFKGLNPVNTAAYKILNTITFQDFSDCRHEKFLIVAKH